MAQATTPSTTWQLGERLTKGLGAGANPKVARPCAGRSGRCVLSLNKSILHALLHLIRIPWHPPRHCGRVGRITLVQYTYQNEGSLSIIHPAQALWTHHHPPRGYPAGVLPVPEPIPGLAFFPGGFGLWGSAAGQPLPTFPVGGIMVLGHDFHSEHGYWKSFQRQTEPRTVPTWRNLEKLLFEVDIKPERCFFTNLYMGLRAGSATTGHFPGASDPAFVAHCQHFFLEQLRVQHPKLLLTLGVHVPPVIGVLSPQLGPWAAGRGLRHLDAVGPVQANVTFHSVEGFATTAVALTHPSLRHASVRHRRYRGVEKHEAEVQMLRDALAVAGIAVR